MTKYPAGYCFLWTSIEPVHVWIVLSGKDDDGDLPLVSFTTTTQRDLARAAQPGAEPLIAVDQSEYGWLTHATHIAYGMMDRLTEQRLD